MAKTKPGAKAETNGVLPKLKSVYEFMTQNNLETLELDEAGLHLKMVRRKAVAPMAVPVPVMMTSAAMPVASPAAATPVTAAPAGLTIKSSMMGIFYRASSPSSPPFVKEGEAVKAGQILCMVEAMKVFNEIKAEYPCTVIKTLLENGKPVKAGQDIFLVQRS
jgi:acetyl-CoA carboxylase biotin carboxyl carrier protein